MASHFADVLDLGAPSPASTADAARDRSSDPFLVVEQA